MRFSTGTNDEVPRQGDGESDLSKLDADTVLQEVPLKANGQIDTQNAETQRIIEGMNVFQHSAKETIAKGAGTNLPNVLAVVDQLPPWIKLLKDHETEQVAQALLEKFKKLLSDGLRLLHGEFVALLEKPSRLQEEPLNLRADFLEQIAEMRAAGGGVDAQFRIPEMPSPEEVKILHELVNRLVLNQWKPEKAISFKETRARTLSKNLQRLDFRPISKDEARKLTWPQLEPRMKRWCEHMRAAVKILFKGERTLCDGVLVKLENFRDRCFAELAGPSLLQLLYTGNCLATAHEQMPEKIVALLWMYKAVRDLLPLIGETFRGDPGASYRQDTEAFLDTLKVVVKVAGEDFAKKLDEEQQVLAQRPPATRRQRGPLTLDPALASEVKVHRHVSYVMNYIRLLCSSGGDSENYLALLQEVYDGPKSAKDSEAVGGAYPVGPARNLRLAVLKILDSLDSLVHTRAKLLPDGFLVFCFLINNHRYILMHVRQHAADLFDLEWRNRKEEMQESRLAHFVGLYTVKMDEQVFSLRETTDPKVVMQRLKAFNAEWDALPRNYAHRLIDALGDRGRVCDAIVKRISAGYSNFITTHWQIIQENPKVQKLVLHTPDAVRTELMSAFNPNLPTT
eukprot:TRINITY_DN950_c1_g1_i1.p1 TRINITY_DN950_c1_g1~~TRINITY_DN950_c1_g1_i1.p1  ORF type:complete len:624 (+),score=152.88 TRINITY_DN950_c1_g1_i1:555-2426(+)